VSQDHELPNKNHKTRKPFAFRIIKKLLVVGVIAVAGLFAMNMMATKPTNLGINNGMLAECPDSPNCVSSTASDEAHKMEPIKLEGVDDPLKKIKSVIADDFSRATLITETEDYLHYEFTSLLFRFVDDVEFYLDDGGVVQFRSASRVGHSDMGANRQRMSKVIQGLTK